MSARRCYQFVGWGIGWVSILEPPTIKSLLRNPYDIELIAYLCLGYVDSFANAPDLQRQGWEQLTDPSALVCADYFDQPYPFVGAGK